MQTNVNRSTHSRDGVFLLALLITLTWCTSVSALEIPLTVEEPAGIQRVSEPVTSGIPLPEGTQTTNWSLWDGSQEIPLQVTGLGGRTPWILLDFQVDVSGSGQKLLFLRDTTSTVTPSSPLVITEDSAQITVTTGPLKVLLKKNPFNLLEAVWLDGDNDGSFTSAEQVVGSSGDNIQVKDSTSGQIFSGTGSPTSWSGSTEVPCAPPSE